jgi:hypothetical protein
MNRLPEKGEFLYTKEKQIVDAEWMDAEMGNEITTFHEGEKLSLLVQTRNYEEGENITIQVREENSKELQKGIKEIILTGIVQADGTAVLKEEIEIEIEEYQELPKEKTTEELRQEEEQKKQQEEYKKWEEEQWQKYLARKNRRGFFGFFR